MSGVDVQCEVRPLFYSLRRLGSSFKSCTFNRRGTSCIWVLFGLYYLARGSRASRTHVAQPIRFKDAGTPSGSVGRPRVLMVTGVPSEMNDNGRGYARRRKSLRVLVVVMFIHFVK